MGNSQTGWVSSEYAEEDWLLEERVSVRRDEARLFCRLVIGRENGRVISIVS